MKIPDELKNQSTRALMILLAPALIITSCTAADDPPPRHCFKESICFKNMKKILCDEQFGAVTHALPSAASFSTITYKFRHPEATSGCRDLSRGVYNRKQTASSTSTIFVRRRSLAGQQEWQKKEHQQLQLLLSSIVCAPRLHLREPAAVMKLLQWTKCAHLLQLSCNGALTGSSTIH